jgi:hypothetical protein
MATPMQMTYTDKDWEPKSSYDDLLDGNDYIGTLTEVTDIEAKTGNVGWGFVFDVQGLSLTSRIWLKGGGKWRINEVFNALGEPIAPGTSTAFLDPNVLVGRTCVVTIEKESANDGTDRKWTNIKRHTPLAAEELPTL